ncbi:hypothetical protein BDU57DRAFT_577924 [Ampelomyces quisqualis]|uniref:Uncharacterized protein n=1 Tax=Ampelomyces quisqualis TaxID=50730 RepID=A0A6A5QHB8_AMPQU|nr:hypothetical protein BDU57DRAFT_577924 [Ampelomyces quisqualis]
MAKAESRRMHKIPFCVGVKLKKPEHRPPPAQGHQSKEASSCFQKRAIRLLAATTHDWQHAAALRGRYVQNRHLADEAQGIRHHVAGSPICPEQRTAIAGAKGQASYRSLIYSGSSRCFVSETSTIAQCNASPADELWGLQFTAESAHPADGRVLAKTLARGSSAASSPIPSDYRIPWPYEYCAQVVPVSTVAVPRIC